MPLPPALPPDQYRLALSLVTPEQVRLPVAGADQLLLTTVTTVDRPRTFDPPKPQLSLEVSFNDQAKLIGLDLGQQTVRPGEGLPLTLYWQALAGFDKSWSVFVHLVDENNRIISQQDQIPGAGQFPTTGWVAGEYLADTYNLPIPADASPGREKYWLEIGLYDPNDFSRLPVVEKGRVVDNHFVLEGWPISIE
jgi:hypothetical protein